MLLGDNTGGVTVVLRMEFGSKSEYTCDHTHTQFRLAQNSFWAGHSEKITISQFGECLQWFHI